MPLFSIVIVNYNHGQFLEKAICSILDQSHNDFELIIVDGASTDNSTQIIHKYADRLSWWVSEPDKGQSDAFNKGFAKATGDYFFWLNADDLMMPGSLCAAADYLNKHPDCMWLTGDTVYFDVHGIIQRCLYGPYWNTWLMKQTLVCNMVNGPSSIFHRSLFEKAGGFDTQLSYTMDMDLWFKFVDCGACFHRLHRYIWGFRIHEGSKTSHAINGYLADEFTYERDKAILRAKRTRKQTEFWWLRLWKFVTGTHFHTLYDTWRWRHLSIEKKISDLALSNIGKGA